jgi:hypothetical protein
LNLRPPEPHSAEHAFSHLFLFEIILDIRKHGEPGNEWLIIETVEVPHEQYGWVNGGCISIPLAMYPELKEGLIRFDPAIGEVDGEGAGASSQGRVDI